MPRSLVSADMKVYALQLKMKLQAFLTEFCDIFEQLPSRIILGTTPEKKGKDKKAPSDLVVSDFSFFKDNYS